MAITNREVKPGFDQDTWDKLFSNTGCTDFNCLKNTATVKDLVKGWFHLLTVQKEQNF